MSYPGTPIALTRGGFPASGATVTVCTGVVTVTLANSPPCAPYATIYSDPALTLPITQPGFKTDGLGNYPFFVAAGGGAYTVVLTGNGFTGTSTVWVAPLIGTLPNVFSGLQSFDAALALKEIAAPSGLANYEVLYGNTATHRLVVKLNSAAEDAIVTDAGAATLTNKTTTNLVINGNPSGTGVCTFTLKKGTGVGDYTTSSTSFVDVDATNLALTQTIPVGWKLSASTALDVYQSTAGNEIQVALFDSSVLDARRISGGLNVFESTGLTWVITGDGASHTVKLQFKTGSGADAANIVNQSGNTWLPTMSFALCPSN